MTREEFQKLTQDVVLLDGATGSNLMAAGMPRGICTEAWIMEHKEVLQNLQKAVYAQPPHLILSIILFVPCYRSLSQRSKDGNMPMGGVYGTIGLPDFGYFRFDILYSVTLVEHDSSHTADNDYQYNISYKYSMLQ